MPFPLEAGVSLTFAAATGYPQQKFVVQCVSMLPTVTNVTSSHSGLRSRPALGPAAAADANFGNLPNRGSLIGLVVPYSGAKVFNSGPATLTALPTDGDSRVGSGGLSNLDLHVLNAQARPLIPTPGSHS